MKVLLDTHTFIWFVNGDQSLSDKVIAKIKNVEINVSLALPVYGKLP